MKWSNGIGLRLLLCLVLLLAGLVVASGQGVQPTLPSSSIVLTSPLPDLTQLTPEQLWATFWPTWLSLGNNLQQVKELPLQLKAWQESYKLMQTEDGQTIADLQIQLLLSQAAQTQASTSTGNAQQSSQQSITDISHQQQSLAAVDADVKKTVRNLELQRSAWKVAGISFGVIAVVEAVLLTVHKAW